MTVKGIPGIEANKWRQNTPGAAGWAGSARPGAANKYLMVSCDAHVNEPAGFIDSMPPHLKAAMPRIETDADGVKWEIVPGMRPIKAIYQGEGDEEDNLRVNSGRSPDQIIENMDRDGVDIQVSFPNKGFAIQAIRDPDKIYPMARGYNDWQAQYFRDIKDRLLPMAMIFGSDIDRAIEEVERVAKMDFFRGFMLPGKAVFGPDNVNDLAYNDPAFDKLWAAIQDKDLAITFHCATANDTRQAKGPGAAVTCYAAYSHPSVIPAVSHMCASGILDKFPGLRFATIESGIGYVPWILTAMDEGYKKHHLWIKHKLKKLPSEYFYEHGFASFQEEPSALAIIDPRLGDSYGEYRKLENCFLWANDFPHHEGSWPHSAAAIERQMQNLTEEQRIKILGGNAVRCFKIEDLAAKRRNKPKAAAAE